MAARTRLALDGYGARRAGSFAGKIAHRRTLGTITRLSLDGYFTRRFVTPTPPPPGTGADKATLFIRNLGRMMNR